MVIFVIELFIAGPIAATFHINGTVLLLLQVAPILIAVAVVLKILDVF